MTPTPPTLGSLFDGSGGFPLAGALCGFRPVWASEIEPFPLAVTRARIPSMRHLGDVTRIRGGEIEPVDVITFGSPCQDLSKAGKQKGLKKGERSSLFFHALRIISEMRSATGGRYPRYAVWENVHGAYGSNKGADFAEVLAAFCAEAGHTEPLPRPAGGKWPNAGQIVGDGYTIAWRTLDAKYWGVPQRRRRIYLVADFRGDSAPQVLFNREGLRRHTAAGVGAGEATAGNAGGGAGRSDCAGSECLNGWESQARRVYGVGGVMPPLSTCGQRGSNQQAVLYPAEWHSLTATNARNPESAQRPNCVVYPTCVYDTTQITSPHNRSAPEHNGPCHTLSAQQHLPLVVQAYNESGKGYWMEGFGCLRAEGENRESRPGHVIAIMGNIIDRPDTSRCNGAGYNEQESYTLNTVDRHAVAIDCRSHNVTTESGTLQAKGQGGHSLNFINPVYYTNQGYGRYAERGVASTIRASIDPSVADLIVSGAPKKAKRKYIVRRLTPTECARLQGFPDWWTAGLGIETPTEADIAFWDEAFETYRIATGGKKRKTRRQIIKWIKDPYSDSAAYKMWGNGIALPCAEYVLEGVGMAMEREAGKRDNPGMISEER